jgi:O-antigen ligase
MMNGIPLYLMATQGFFTENKVPIFLAGVVMAIVGGVLAARSYMLRTLAFLGFMATLVFPTIDINFFVDTKFVGVPSARGIYITAADLAVLALLVAVLMRGGNQRVRTRFPGFLPYMAYIAIAGLSILNMVSHGPPGLLNAPAAYGFFEWFNIIKGLIVFWVMVNFIQGEKEIRLVLTLLMAVILVEAVVVLYQQYVQHIYRRAAGSLDHENALAMFIGLILPTIFVLMLSHRRSGAIPWILAIFFVVGVGLMIKTVSRGGLMAMIASCSIAGALLVVRVRRLHAVRIALLIILVGVGGSALAYRYWDKLMARFNVSTPEAIASTQSRIVLFNDGVYIWLKNPILGNGVNSFPIELALKRQGRTGVAEEHNLYLLSLCEVGVVGLLAFFAIIARVFQIAIRLVRQNISPGFQVLAIGLACGMLHVLIESGFEFVFRMVFISYVFWMFAAVIISSWYMLKNQAAQIQMARYVFARRMTAAKSSAPSAAERGRSTVRQ